MSGPSDSFHTGARTSSIGKLRLQAQYDDYGQRSLPSSTPVPDAWHRDHHLRHVTSVPITRPNLFKHPDRVKCWHKRSGVYDLRDLMMGMYDDNFTRQPKPRPYMNQNDLCMVSPAY